MFIPSADTTCLRQGDILTPIPFPRISSGDIAILGSVEGKQQGAGTLPLVARTHTHRDDPKWLTAQVPVRLSHCAVISQCCDLQPKHGRILIPTIAIARLIPIPRGILSDPQRLESLRQNKDPRNSSDPGYINFFYVPPHEFLDSQEWVVDYNQALCIPASEYPEVLRIKILQMDDRWRVKFKIKLAVSIARLTDEERASGLENPWHSVH